MKNKKPSAKQIRKRVIRKYYRKQIRVPFKIILLIVLIGILYLLIPNVLAHGEDQYAYLHYFPKAEEKENIYPILPDKQYKKLLETNPTFKNYISGMKVKRNNPGNLLYMGQPKATKCDNSSFACFPSVEVGFRALVMQVYAYQNRGVTLEEFINKYSPPHENDTPYLIEIASSELNIKPNHLLANLDTIKIAQVMARQEFSIKIINY